MYGAKFVKGMKMDKYLEDLEDYRRQLENMNDRIGDAEMASIILTGVEGTHRNVVRMFNRDANPPDLERVLNSLRSEAEMDEAEAENTDTSKKKKDEGDKMIGSVKGKRAWQGKKQNKVGPGKKAQGSGAWKETRECHFCHKVGHLRAKCRNLPAHVRAGRWELVALRQRKLFVEALDTRNLYL
ncbi:unnamed protein product [Phytophthora fragariaefolia]|uniref:Unnamed protein product n=1 Tax=Phytophthora fragariaefolia TaxID=1490495 RepID=A0A9W6X6W7_9STRA|nr:unnamed protein product [Phytophthora fragariaefolia]